MLTPARSDELFAKLWLTVAVVCLSAAFCRRLPAPGKVQVGNGLSSNCWDLIIQNASSPPAGEYRRSIASSLDADLAIIAGRQGGHTSAAKLCKQCDISCVKTLANCQAAASSAISPRIPISSPASSPGSRSWNWRAVERTETSSCPWSCHCHTNLGPSNACTRLPMSADPSLMPAFLMQECFMHPIPKAIRAIFTRM